MTEQDPIFGDKRPTTRTVNNMLVWLGGVCLPLVLVLLMLWIG